MSDAITKTLVCIDVDGVINSFSKNAKGLSTGNIDQYEIRWRADVLDRFKILLERDDVTPVWLTDWLQFPAMLRRLEELLSWEDVVPFHAESPWVVSGWGTERNQRFIGVTQTMNTHLWWKYKALELLDARFNPERLAFLDDNLGRVSSGIPDRYKRGVTHEKFFHRTHEVAGLLHEDLDKFEKWLDAKPEDF